MSLTLWSFTALGGPIHTGYEGLGIVLGLVAKGHKSFECCCVQLKPFAPFANKHPLFSLSISHAHTSRHTHSITPLASLPLWVREIYGKKLGSSSAVFPPGGVTATFVFQGSSRWREKQAQWSQRIGTSKTLCVPPEIAEHQPLSKMNSSGVKLVVISQIFISLRLMKMYKRCETRRRALFPLAVPLYLSLETWKRTRGKQLYIQWRCLAADDIVLLGEPEFGPTTWAGGDRCSLEAPIFFALFVLVLKSHVCHRNLNCLLLMRWRRESVLSLKRCLTGVPEEADNVFSRRIFKLSSPSVPALMESSLVN